jgi:hypothetical protein
MKCFLWVRQGDVLDKPPKMRKERIWMNSPTVILSQSLQEAEVEAKTIDETQGSGGGRNSKDRKTVCIFEVGWINTIGDEGVF